MTLKGIAIDDEPLALELIKDYSKRIPDLYLVQTFEDAISGAEFLTQNSVDVLFIDIDMPDITGVDLVRSLKTKPFIIFTTAYKRYAYEGFELEALDYILKPMDFNRFSKAVSKALDLKRYKESEREQDIESLYVYSEYRLIKVPLKDIEYIESLEDYVRIILSDGKSILTLGSMKKVLEKLPADRFRRIHRSYIIPVGKVKSISNRRVHLSCSVELPISNSYISFVKELIRR